MEPNDGILSAIGNTPLVRLQRIVPAGAAEVWLKLEGVGVGFEPPFLERERLSDIRTIDQKVAFDTCRRLAREDGIFCGASSGLNVAAAIQLATENGPGKRVVTLACDTGLKYLGGHIFS